MTPTDKYRKNKCKALTIRFYPKDVKVYEHIKEQPQIAKYIIELVKKDMDGK